MSYRGCSVGNEIPGHNNLFKDTAARDQCKNVKQNSVIKQKCIIENS